MKDDNYIRFDWAIKRLLRDKANFGVLEGLLTTLLNEQIHITNLIESESNQNTADDKYNRVDLMALNTKGEYIIVEVQITGDFDYFRRMLYGVSKTITEHMKLGMSYKEVKKVYSVNIVYFNMGIKDDYVYHGTTEFRGIHSRTVLRMTDRERISFGIGEVKDVYPEYYLLCVNNFDDVALTPLDEWIDYLKSSRIKDTATAPGLAQARELLRQDQMLPGDLANYESYLKNYASEMDTLNNAVRDGKIEGYAKGKEEGLEEGRLAEKRQLISNMQQQGLALETIALYTGITPEEINRILSGN